jgi:uncharacterized protein (DUF1684 family)
MPRHALKARVAKLAGNGVRDIRARILLAPVLAAVTLFLAAAGISAPTQTNEALMKEEADFRAQREARLTAPDGWLAVAGLFWLREGATVVGSAPQSDIVLPAGAPKRAGILRMRADKVTFEPASGVMINGKPAAAMALKPDTDDHPDVVQAGSIALTIIKRGGRVGVRMRDPDAATRRNFTGCKWFPVSQSWRIEAKWVAYPEPKKLKITNILGMTDEEPSPGYAEFTTGGRTMRLEPVEDNTGLEFMFRDATSGDTTYAPGRFLDTDAPKGGLSKNGVIVLDFNQAYNPPCAFTAYATCPLPPKQNTLPLAVEAGEKKYGPHPEPGAH